MPRLGDLVGGVIAIGGCRPAIEYDREWWSWHDLAAIMDAIGGILQRYGVDAQTRVGGILRNRPEIAAAIIAIITTDRCVVTLNPMLQDDRLAGDIVSLKTPVVIALAQDWARTEVRQAAAQLGCLCIELTGDKSQPARVIQEMSRNSDFDLQADGIGIEMLTSGTTGTPKRIPLKTRNFERMVLDTAVYESRDAAAPPTLRGGVQILNTPFSHIGGIFGLFTCLSAGRKACLLDRFTVEHFVDAIRRHRPKTVSAPPSALRMILDADIPKDDLSSLQVFRTATAPLDPDLADAFHARYGIPVLQNYGATEFAGGVAGWTIGDFKRFHQTKRGSVGRMNPGIGARIVDAETGIVMAHGEAGLLELRAQHLGDGATWIRTTDIAKLDADDFLWILGRHDNAIIRGGFKIIPDDVVRAMEAHPAVREASVIAMPDPRLGQVPVAAYIVKSGLAVEEAELRSFLRERLLPYQLPKILLALKELPRTPSMKVSQPELRKMFQEVVPVA